MIDVEQLQPGAAERAVRQGSDIVVIPYGSYLEPDGTVRLTIYTQMAAHAAAELYTSADRENTTMVAVGEHTYGKDKPSTTDLIYDFLGRQAILTSAFATERPRNANATPQQVSWLQRTYGQRWQDRTPVLVGQRQHWPRIAYLCRLYGLPATFLDAQDMLGEAGSLTPAYKEAATLYEQHNQRYERDAGRLTRIVSDVGACLGSRAATMTTAFRVLSYLRTPNVVDVVHNGGEAEFYAVPVRKHKQNLRKGIV